MCLFRCKFRRSVGRSALGFTIIELLVSIGVTALMLTLMITIALNMLNGWNRTSGLLTTGNQARLVLDLLSQDLQAAVIRRDGKVWLAATVQSDQTVTDDAGIDQIFNSTWSGAPAGQVKPDSGAVIGPSNSLDLRANLPSDIADQGKIHNVRFGNGGVWLRFITNPPAANTSLATLSAPRAVSYQISRGRIGPVGLEGQHFYALFRAEAAPNDTFAAGYNVTDSRYETYAAANPTSVLRRPTADELIANNVVDFGVRLYQRNAAGALFESFPVIRDSNGVVTSHSTALPVSFLGTSDTAAAYGGTVLARGLPVSAEIMVRILTPEGVRQIQALENDLIKPPPGVPSAEYWWQIVDQNSQVYTRRVEIRSTAL